MWYEIRIYFHVSACVYLVFSISFVNAAYLSPFHVLAFCAENHVIVEMNSFLESLLPLVYMSTNLPVL